MANKYTLSEEEKALFRAAVEQVGRSNLPIKTIENRKAILLKKSRLSSAHHLEGDIGKTATEKQRLALSDYLKEEVEGNTLLSYGEANYLRREVTSLRLGKKRCQAKIDLHGLKIERAKEKLIDFILNQQHIGNRCLLVIHGKGERDGKKPILKNLINRWLPQFPQILAFHSASSREGGCGAVYVWLKKRTMD
ncbi:MAG: Smr/MutS family protein [Legionella sp.]|nr:Smr/MutS family protein [Legionella sp.]